MSTYRAAYWISKDRQNEVVLTAPADAGLSDDALEAEALAEAARQGLEIGDGSIEIGDWTE